MEPKDVAITPALSVLLFVFGVNGWFLLGFAPVMWVIIGVALMIWT